MEPIVQVQYIKENLRIRLTHAMIAVFVAFKTTCKPRIEETYNNELFSRK